MIEDEVLTKIDNYRCFLFKNIHVNIKLFEREIILMYSLGHCIALFLTNLLEIVAYGYKKKNIFILFGVLLFIYMK